MPSDAGRGHPPHPGAATQPSSSCCSFAHATGRLLLSRNRRRLTTATLIAGMGVDRRREVHVTITPVKAVRPPATSASSTSFEVRREQEKGSVVIHVRGDVDLAVADDLADQLKRAIEPRKRLVIDLSQTASIDSSGLSALISAYRAIGQIREAMVLRSPSRPVLRALRATGIDRLLTIELVSANQTNPPTAR